MERFLNVLRRLAITGLVAILPTTAFATKDYTDWWWNPSLNGMGFNIGQQEGLMFLMWYLYGDDGKATFLQLAGPMSGDKLEGNLYRSSGPPPGPGYNPGNFSVTKVGTASVQFAGDNSAVFAYNYEGKSGTITIQRYSYGLLKLDGLWLFTTTGISTSCQSPGDNGSVLTAGVLTVSAEGNMYEMQLQYGDDVDTTSECRFSLPLERAGALASGSGTYTCNTGRAGNVEVKALRRIDDVIMFEYVLRDTVGDSCVTTGTLSGPKLFAMP
ncbi:MAG: hypothetical protein MUE62_06305 [Burkholderiaceae bacterium]|jgi:hypothetical protein|nr:hypothetical protein [Burkholderiaceae bacterium]